MAKNRRKIEDQKLECSQAILPVKDALDVLNGRWKLQIIISLYYENKRFNEISKEVHGITDKVLSKELKDMELNKLISRTVYDTFPPTVEYAITEHGKSLKEILVELSKWGIKHRKVILGK